MRNPTYIEAVFNKWEKNNASFPDMFKSQEKIMLIQKIILC